MKANHTSLTDFQARQVRAVAREAGISIMGFLNNPDRLEIYEKTDGDGLTSHYTSADLAADACIKKHLTRITPDIPILSEEDDLATQRRAIAGGTYWSVDPLDGTSTAMKYAHNIKDGKPTDKNHFFGVLIGLVKDGKPVYGVAHYPVLEGGFTDFTNEKGTQSFRQNGEGVPLPLRVRQSSAPAPLIASVGWEDADAMFMPEAGGALCIGGEAIEPQRLSGSRILHVAEGKADVGFLQHGKFPPGPWDIDALAAIAQGAGAHLYSVPHGIGGTTTRDWTKDAKPLDDTPLPPEGELRRGHVLVVTPQAAQRFELPVERVRQQSAAR